MAYVVFYEKPGCGGNARQKKTLMESGHVLEVRDLLSHPWTAAALMEFFGDLPPALWFNRAAPAVKSGEIVPETMSADQAMTALLAQPLLIRRPLMQAGQIRMVGWDEDLVAAKIGLVKAGLGEGCPRGEESKPCPSPHDAA